MGLDDNSMSDQQISVSSELDRNHGIPNLKLSDDSAWQPLTNSPTEFIQVQLPIYIVSKSTFFFSVISLILWNRAI